MATFSERLKLLRLEKEKTLEALAHELGTTKTTLSRYENNKRTPDSDFIKIAADYFNVTTDYLLGRSDIRNPYEQKSNVSDNIDENKQNKSFDIDDLSPESKKELEKFIELLRLKDKMDKINDETSSALDENVQ